MPTLTALQTQMDIHMGKTPALDVYKQIDDIAYTMRVVAKAADYTVKASESGTVFIQTVGDVDFTLPTREAGLIYWFLGSSNHEVRVTSDVTQKMTTFNDAAAAYVEFTTTGEQIGCGFMVFCDDGLFWDVCPIPGLVDATMGIA